MSEIPLMPGREPTAQQPSAQYPPPPGPGPYPVAPRPPQPKANWKIIIGGVAALLVAMLLVFAAVALLGSRSGGKAADVEISRCAIAGGVAQITVRAQNSSDSTRDYRVDIEIRNGGNDRVADGTVRVNDVAPGDIAYSDAVVSVAGSGETCGITSVR